MQTRSPRALSSQAACRAAARLARQVELALADLGLSLPQYRLLALLTEGQAVASALADLLAVSPPSVTALVDGLVQRGLVERRPDPTDRRRVAHVLTSEGTSILAGADTAIAGRLGTIADHLPTPAAAAAVSGLERWQDALDAARDARLESR